MADLNEKSILDSTKKSLGIEPDDTSFDLDIINLINSAFSTLHQLGVGPETAFEIEDKSNEWSEFIEDARFNSVKSYIYSKCRLIFDPPTPHYANSAIEKMISELEWRLMIASERRD